MQKLKLKAEESVIVRLYAYAYNLTIDTTQYGMW